MLILARDNSEMTIDEGSDSDEEFEIAAHDIVPEYTLNAGNYGPKAVSNDSKITTTKTLKMQRQT